MRVPKNNQLALCQNFAWRPPVADKFADKFKAARSTKLPAINQTIKKNAPQKWLKKRMPPTSEPEGEGVVGAGTGGTVDCRLGEIISKHVDCYWSALLIKPTENQGPGQGSSSGSGLNSESESGTGTLTSDMHGLGGHQSDTMSPVKILNQIRGGMSSLCKEASWLSLWSSISEQQARTTCKACRPDIYNLHCCKGLVEPRGERAVA